MAASDPLGTFTRSGILKTEAIAATHDYRASDTTSNKGANLAHPTASLVRMLLWSPGTLDQHVGRAETHDVLVVDQQGPWLGGPRGI